MAQAPGGGQVSDDTSRDRDRAADDMAPATRRNDDARAAILGGIRASLRRAGELPASVRAGLQARLARPPRNIVPAVEGDLVERFVARLSAVSGMVTRVQSLREVPAVVEAHLQRFSLPGELVVAPDPALADIVWPNTLGVRHGRSEGSDLVSFTGAFAGVAETGSLVLLSGAHSPTTLNFLPDDHLVLLPAQRIVRHLEDAFDRLRDEHGEMPRTLNFITGPSKTADVEQVIQEGAHGPRRLHVLLLDAPAAG